jgi:splicing factor 3B subunit 1
MSDSEFDQIRKLQAERNAAAASSKKGSGSRDLTSQRDSSTKANLTDAFDTDLYERNGPDKFAGYHASIPVGADEDGDDMDVDGPDNSRRLVGQYTATRS